MSTSTASTACSSTGSSRSCARCPNTPSARPSSPPSDFEQRPWPLSGGTAFASFLPSACEERVLHAALVARDLGRAARLGQRGGRTDLAEQADPRDRRLRPPEVRPTSFPASSSSHCQRNSGNRSWVENRGGAGTTIGAAMVAKAEPDGYTLLATSSAHTLVPTVYPNASYDTAADFAAVVSLGSSPNVLVVSPSKGFKTAQDLVAAAKARPGSFNFASAGVGSATHLSAERFRMAAGFDAVHVPFRGGAEALAEVLSGRAEFYFCPLGTALPQVREGKLMALAVSSPKRAALLPDVPSVLELFPNSDYPFWIGIFMPAKTPRDIVEKLHREAVNTMQSPNVKERLETLGMEPMPLTPAEFDAHVRAEIGTTGALARAAGLKPTQ